MRLDKIKNTFNDYKWELSWGQLEAIRTALEADHSEPVADEMLAELSWYMDRVPGPGEDEEEVKAREEGMMPGAGGEGGEGGEGGMPVEMPPSEGAADTGQPPGAPPEEMPGGEGAPPPEGGAPPAEEGQPIDAEGGQPPEGGAMPPMEGQPPPPEEADQHLAAPPVE